MLDAFESAEAYGAYDPVSDTIPEMLSLDQLSGSVINVEHGTLVHIKSVGIANDKN
jgi:hypothetical protein